ncbi:MAG: DUF3185 family protein [Deltaproteobacteria bacterium]|nr:DUF3185 family protein [Deltaproteobacteria bacterium]
MKLIGIVLLVVGAGLAFWGLQMSGSLGSKITRAISGSDTDKVMFAYIGGAASFASGLFLLLKK